MNKLTEDTRCTADKLQDEELRNCIYKIRESAWDILNEWSPRWQENITFLDKMCGPIGGLAHYVDQDYQGLTQPSACLNMAKHVGLVASLSACGFNTKMFPKLSSNSKKHERSDILIDNHFGEVKGNLTKQSQDKLNKVRGGTLDVKHPHKLYFIGMGRVDVNTAILVSLRLVLRYIDSRAFIKGNKTKTTISCLSDPKFDECDFMGMWEIGYGENLQNTI